VKRFDDVLYTINPSNGSVDRTFIWSDEFINHWDRTAADKFEKGEIEFNFSGGWEKISTEKFTIESYTGGFVVTKPLKNLFKEDSFSIDLNNSLVYYKTNWGVNDSQNHTSKIQCNNKNLETEPETASGTAFFINNKGNLLTNHHVVDECKVLKINYFDKEYEAQLIAKDKTLDLALLKVDVRPKSYINFSNYNPKKLQKIYVAGYPFGKGLSDDLKISSGIISSLKGAEDNSNELQIDAAINHGNSGGPIVGEGGELIGIAVSGLAKEVSEGINFGIKSSAALNFLGANEIDPSRVNRSSMNSDKLLKILEESTLFISCTY